ncbi:hypothetical protein ACPV5W_06240 [Vibrio astriarenae]
MVYNIVEMTNVVVWRLIQFLALNRFLLGAVFYQEYEYVNQTRVSTAKYLFDMVLDNKKIFTSWFFESVSFWAKGVNWLQYGKTSAQYQGI